MNARINLSLLATVVLSVLFLAFGYTTVSADASVEHVIEITGFKFVPDSIDVNKGDTITWVNLDIAPHTATANDSTFDTGEIKMGESVSIEVSRDRVVSYFCLYHPMMKAEVR